MRGELFPISQVPGQAVYIAEYPKNDNSPRNPEQDKKRIENDYEDRYAGNTHTCHESLRRHACDHYAVA